MNTDYKLTQYSHGAGCGCKIAPRVLDEMLSAAGPAASFSGSLLVGNETRDDAAVLLWNEGEAVVSTTDFFMPIVDDPEDFGRIAAVNAISDIYAMGGTPLLAIAILGWPVNVLPPEIAGRVLAGGRKACEAAGIPLAGGHSIDAPEPIFGLAVTGKVRLDHLKRNGGAVPGDLLFLTKPLGVGVLSTAQKKGMLKESHARLALESMTKLNRAGEAFGRLSFVRAMTDVTGFGLLGHLTEMCEASAVSARIYFDQVPLLDTGAIRAYIAAHCVPGGTQRNWNSYGHKIGSVDEFQKAILCDPQTSGGLLVAVDAACQSAFMAAAAVEGLALLPIGEVIPKGNFTVEVG
ncbi:MAG: selenide, water dikinase SelD [Saprospiraceae bacterium]|jgi:selenide,water dikinase